jgi:orotate phosphoribosyltransferase
MTLLDSSLGRPGHFLLESGYHTDLWFDLDSLFVDTVKVRSEVKGLANLIRHYQVTAVCGPLLGGAFLAQAVANELDAHFYFTRKAEPIKEGTFKARYELALSMRQTIGGERVAVVDDVISAGSSTRATVAELQQCGAIVVVVGCFTLFGEKARTYLTSNGIPVVSNSESEFKLWESNSCPLCRENVPLVDPTISA